MVIMANKNNINNLNIKKETIRKARRKRLALKRRIIKLGLAIFVSGAFISAISNKLEDGKIKGEVIDSKNNDIPEGVYIVETDTDALSSLNVVLVNDGIDEEQIKGAESSLKLTGLDVEVRDIDELNKDGTECFIALTNYGGEDYKVIANNKDGNNNADLLAIGMKEAFGCPIQKGVHDKLDLVPSDIEKAVGTQLMPNVTIAVPEGKDLEDYFEDPEKYDTDFSKPFTDSILEGLARYSESLNYVDLYGGEFLLRPNPFDNEEVYRHCFDPEVLSRNDLESPTDFNEDSVLLNSGLPECFDKSTNINVRKADTAVKGSHL